MPLECCDAREDWILTNPTVNGMCVCFVLLEVTDVILCCVGVSNNGQFHGPSQSESRPWLLVFALRGGSGSGRLCRCPLRKPGAGPGGRAAPIRLPNAPACLGRVGLVGARMPAAAQRRASELAPTGKCQCPWHMHPAVRASPGHSIWISAIYTRRTPIKWTVL